MPSPRSLRRTPALALTAAALLAGAGGAFAQDGAGQPQPPAAKEDKVIKIVPVEGGYKVEDLFKYIYKTTGRSILYDSGPSSKVKQLKVEFTGEHLVRESELFSWLQSVISFQQLVLVPVGPIAPDGTQQWYCLEQANQMVRSRPVYLREEQIFEYENRDGLYVVTSVTLQNISDTARVKAALQQLASTSSSIGKVQDVPGSRALILADFAPMVASMKRLLDYIDVESKRTEPNMKVIELTHAVASELEPIITDLVESSDPRQGPNRNPGNAPGAEEDPPPKIIPDDRLDALIVYATERYMTKIEKLIKELDVPSKARGRIHFVPIKHVDATEIASLIEDLIRSSGGTSGVRSSTSRTNRTNTNRAANQPAAGGGGAQGPFGGSAAEGQPVIIPDTTSNSLVIHASPSQVDDIKDLIKELDKARPQVLIETALVELSTSEGLNLGVELFSSQDGITVDTDGDGVADALTDARKFFGNTGYGLADVITTDVNGVAVPTNKSPILGTGLTTGIFKNGKLPVILNAFQSSGRAKIITRPGLVTNDNKEANIKLTRTTSFRESVRTDSNTDRDSFKEVQASTELTISPHISSDNYLRLEIEQSVENFGNRPSPDAPPDKTERSLRTQITLPDGYTVVVGGLVQEEERTSVTKVPVLGDIPVIGFFFRQTEDTSSPAHLFLFVTPHILRDTDFADYHRLSWEKRMEQDDLFGGEVKVGGTNFRGDPDATRPRSAADEVRELSLSGELGAPRLKAPETEAERRARAEEAWRNAQKKEQAPESR
ncbi:MAG: hypothetical protein HMLKMBBP_02587 [Planctomycetes bacterium]|nr:hypothetical protein [Planctomycetota bacterium]